MRDALTVSVDQTDLVGGLVTITSDYARLAGVRISGDMVNDFQITIYDSTAATGNQLMPTTYIDASAMGMDGFVSPYKISYPRKSKNKGMCLQVLATGGGAFGGNFEANVDYFEGGS